MQADTKRDGQGRATNPNRDHRGVRYIYISINICFRKNWDDCYCEKNCSFYLFKLLYHANTLMKFAV